MERGCLEGKNVLAAVMPKINQDVENCISFNIEDEHVLEVSNDESTNACRNEVNLHANLDSGFNVNDDDSAVEAGVGGKSHVGHDAVDKIAVVDARSEDAVIERDDGSSQIVKDLTTNGAKVQMQITPHYVAQYPLPRLNFWKS